MKKRIEKIRGVVGAIISITVTVLVIVALFSFTLLICSAIVKLCWNYLVS